FYLFVITPRRSTYTLFPYTTLFRSDVCGNVSLPVSQTITVNDQTAPVITSVPVNVTVSCAADVPAPNDSAVVATDNCAGTITISDQESIRLNSSHVESSYAVRS